MQLQVQQVAPICALIKAMASANIPANLAIRDRRKSTLAYLALCLLWAASALRPDLLPDLIPASLPYFASQAFLLLLFAAVATLVGRRAKAGRVTTNATGPSILLGITLFALPAILVYFARDYIVGATRTAVLCLIPIVSIVLQPHLGSGIRFLSRHALVAALTALFGVLCSFPVNFPQSPQNILALAALLLAAVSVGAANCLAEALASQTQFLIFPNCTVAAIAAALPLAVASVLYDRNPLANASYSAAAQSSLPALLWIALIDLPALLLLFWLMNRLSAVQLSTRYFSAPLLTVLIGIALLHAQGQIRLRTWIGLLLIAIGTGYLLFAPQASGDNAETGIFSSQPPSPNC
jgi:drug/metabolite transporter (DMT)-like permease